MKENLVSFSTKVADGDLDWDGDWILVGDRDFVKYRPVLAILL